MCGKTFKAFGKQMYDSRQCGNRASYAKHAEKRRQEKRDQRRASKEQAE